MYAEEIRPHRETIDRLNNEIIKLLDERVQAALEIGAIKRKHGKPIVDKTREQEILDVIVKKAKLRNLDPVGVENVFKEIIKLCVDAEEEQ